MKDTRRISINEKECWGRLVDPDKHLAAVGARIIDNRRRAFEFCGDRMTEVGDERAVKILRKWAYGNPMLNMIRKNTRFSFGYPRDENSWGIECMIGRKKDIHAVLKVICSGEYVYLQAYADYHKESADGDQGKKENQ